MSLSQPLLTDGQNYGWRNEYTYCTWAGGAFFPVVPLCQFFSYGRKQFQVLFTYHTSCAFMSFLLLRQEIVIGCTGQFFAVAGNCLRCYLLTNHTSCVVVSVFWLRRKIVFGCTVYKKDYYLFSSIERESTSKCVYFVRSITLLSCNSLLCIYLLYLKDPHTAYLFLVLYGSITLQS